MNDYMNRDVQNREEKKYRLNHEITSQSVRLTGLNQELIGVVSLKEALTMAELHEVDLVEVVPLANPPVCRLIDYGKFLYQEKKKAAEAKSKQVVSETKEIKLRPSTDEADYQVKMKSVRRFISQGDKCKISLKFKGRELSHQEIGMDLMNRIQEELRDESTIEAAPKLEGKQLVMLIGPKRKNVKNK